MAFLHPDDVKLVKNLKKLNVFQSYTKAELSSLTKNGGSAFVCGDGDIDAYSYHAEAVDRPHHQACYGGPLILAHSYKDFSPLFAEYMLRNMKIGMKLKKTNSVFLYFHYPCAAALMFGYPLDQVLGFAHEAISRLKHEDGFDPEKIYVFFHFKWEGKNGRIIQRTYRLIG
jgi:hypothetical protein